MTSTVLDITSAREQEAGHTDRRRLLVAVSRYRRAAGWRHVRKLGLVAPDGSVVVRWDWPSLTGRMLRIDELSGHSHLRPARMLTASYVTSVSHALDVLVAFGLVPVEFFSAYRNGLTAPVAGIHVDQVQPGWYLLGAVEDHEHGLAETAELVLDRRGCDDTDCIYHHEGCVVLTVHATFYESPEVHFVADHQVTVRIPAEVTR